MKPKLLLPVDESSRYVDFVTTRCPFDSCGNSFSHTACSIWLEFIHSFFVFDRGHVGIGRGGLITWCLRRSEGTRIIRPANGRPRCSCSITNRQRHPGRTLEMMGRTIIHLVRRGRWGNSRFVRVASSSSCARKRDLNRVGGIGGSKLPRGRRNCPLGLVRIRPIYGPRWRICDIAGLQVPLDRSLILGGRMTSRSFS